MFKRLLQAFVDLDAGSSISLNYGSFIQQINLEDNAEKAATETLMAVYTIQ